ncbi:thymine DNA glycosylase isoform 2-T4 [Glossina fuscipes fuscipes]
MAAICFDKVLSSARSTKKVTLAASAIAHNGGDDTRDGACLCETSFLDPENSLHISVRNNDLTEEGMDSLNTLAANRMPSICEKRVNQKFFERKRRRLPIQKVGMEGDREKTLGSVSFQRQIQNKSHGYVATNCCAEAKRLRTNSRVRKILRSSSVYIINQEKKGESTKKKVELERLTNKQSKQNNENTKKSKSLNVGQSSVNIKIDEQFLENRKDSKLFWEHGQVDLDGQKQRAYNNQELQKLNSTSIVHWKSEEMVSKNNIQKETNFIKTVTCDCSEKSLAKSPNNVWVCSSHCEKASLKSSAKTTEIFLQATPYTDKKATNESNEEDIVLSHNNNVSSTPEQSHQFQEFDLLRKNSEIFSTSKLTKTGTRANLDDLSDSSNSSSTSTSSSSLTSDISRTSTSKTSEDNGNYRNGCKLGSKFSTDITNNQVTDKRTHEIYNSDTEIEKEDDRHNNVEEDLKTSAKPTNLYNEKIPQKYQSPELYSGNRNNSNIIAGANVNINANNENDGKSSKIVSLNVIADGDKEQHQSIAAAIESQYETMERFDLYKPNLGSDHGTQNDVTSTATESYLPSQNLTQRQTELATVKNDPTNMLTENQLSKPQNDSSIYKNFHSFIHVKTCYDGQSQMDFCYKKLEKHNSSAEELQKYLRCSATTSRDLDSFSLNQIDVGTDKTECRQQYDKAILSTANEICAEVDQHQQQNYQHHDQSKSYSAISQIQPKGQQERHHNEVHLNFHRHQQHRRMPQQSSPGHLFHLQEHQRPNDHELDNEIHHQMLLQIQQQQQQPMQNLHTSLNVTSSQQNAHIIGFLHPNHNVERSPLQAHQQMQDVYQDLMMNDEYNEDPNIRYKLSLSPTNAKPENQDDGYETSAGDVLTPNSHVSSTHSVTPQHHMQHGTMTLLPPAANCDEQRHVHHIQIQRQQSNVDSQLNNNLGADLTSGDTSVNMPPSEPSYHFVDDELTVNETIRGILTPPPQTHNSLAGCKSQDSHSSYMNLNNNPARNTPHADLFGIQQAPESMRSSSDAVSTQKHPQTCFELQCPNKCHNKSQQNHVIFPESSGCAEVSAFCNIATPIQKRRGRKKKLTFIGGTTSLENCTSHNLDAGCHTEQLGKAKERKKHDRFNGMSEEEVVKRTLPDHLCDNLDIVIIGINPGLFAAYKGHHYAGPGNHFWKCLYLSGLTQEQMSADEDYKLIKCGIGFTNMVQRATKGSADLNRKEIKEGSRILLEKLQQFRPKIAVFNGKLIFEVFSGKKDFNFGRQPEYVEGTDTFMWVMPSSSARCAQLPRAADKVPFYTALKKFRDYLNGLISHIDESECVFTEERIREQCEQESLKTFVIHDSSQQQQSRCYSAAGNIGPNNSNQSQNSSAIADSYIYDSEANRNQTEGQKIPEKKKRGRPKKIRNQIIIDPVTGTKIQVTNRLTGEEYNNILNLSMVPSMEGDIPKKKRGRPKKVKQPQPFLNTNSHPSKLTQKANIMSVKTLSVPNGDLELPPQKHMLHGESTAMYATSPHQMMYSNSGSPTALSAISCSYTKKTPPILATSNPNCEKHTNVGETEVIGAPVDTDTPSLVIQLMPSAADSNDPHMNQSPRENSPNLQGQVETSASIVSSAQVLDLEDEEIISLRHRQEVPNSRYGSPGQRERAEHASGEPFHQWLSPQLSHTHSPTAGFTQSLQPQIRCPSPLSHNQQPGLHYHEQQVQHIQMQQNHQQQVLPQWSRHNQHYDDVSGTLYIVSPRQERSHHIAEQHQNNVTSPFITADVSRKSLSGLESLVDQIPTISENESATLAASTPTIHAHSLQGQSQQQTSFTEAQTNPFGSPSISNPSVLNDNVNNQHSNLSSQSVNGNFSVSSLVTSLPTSDANLANRENYTPIQTPRPPSARNTYHHSNFMAAAVLAAAAASSPTNLSTSTSHHAPHPQMYMDPQTRLAAVDSIYSTAHHHHPIHHHHHPSSHHHPATHYSSSQHAVDYDGNPYSTQTNAHTLHMPSPNYPYSYSTSAAQSNYPTYGHPHAAHHGHPHAHPHSHATHHLSMFDRFKPSDIGGYGGF